MNENEIENSEETRNDREELAYYEKHFPHTPIRFRHIDWTNERIKLVDALKMLETEPGRGFIIWRNGCPYILSAGHLAKAALQLDAIAKDAEKDGLKPDTFNLKRVFEAKELEIVGDLDALEHETSVNPCSAEAEFYEALYYGGYRGELTAADYSLLVEELTRRNPKIRTHLERWRKNIELGI